MFEVRPNRPDEGQRIVSIWRAAVAATHEFLSPQDRKEIDLEAQAYLLSAALWVAVDPQDQPVAFMGLGVERLEALFVHPEHRGKGIGRTLVSFAATLHPALDTEVNAQNEQALGFYRRLGFVEIGYSRMAKAEPIRWSACGSSPIRAAPRAANQGCRRSLGGG